MIAAAACAAYVGQRITRCTMHEMVHRPLARCLTSPVFVRIKQDHQSESVHAPLIPEILCQGCRCDSLRLQSCRAARARILRRGVGILWDCDSPSLDCRSTASFAALSLRLPATGCGSALFFPVLYHAMHHECLYRWSGCLPAFPWRRNKQCCLFGPFSRQDMSTVRQLQHGLVPCAAVGARHRQRHVPEFRGR